MNNDRHVLITVGLGFLSSQLCGQLLRLGYSITVVSDLLYGGETLLTYFSHPGFKFVKSIICESWAMGSALDSGWSTPEAIVHLAEIVGFPTSQTFGGQIAWGYKDLTFSGDMRDFHVSFNKVHENLGFETSYSVEVGVREVLPASRIGMIGNPQDHRCRNANFNVT